ncbi:MAG TPA: sigma-70 family RNA polymerase sigma factor [Nakamurella sp.]
MPKVPFERVVAQYGRTVLRVCRALLDPTDADDAWAETFLAALRAYPDLPAAANVEAWLVTIAHRKAIDVVRARRRRAIPVADTPDAASAIGNPSEPADDLWAAVRALPDRQRHAVAYHHVAGLPHRDVAQILGGSPESARRAAADGIKALRRTLAQQEEIPT